MPEPIELIGKKWGRLGEYGTTLLYEPPAVRALYKRPKRDYEDDLSAKYEAMMREQVWGGIQPQPRYRPAFYETLEGLEGTRPYMDWFESMFPSLVHRFEARLETYKGYRSAEYAAEEAEKIEKSWAKWLQKKQGELEEQWWSLGWRERGERPYAFAPRIQTLGF